MKIRKSLGAALRCVRLSRGLTQEDFGLVSSRTYVSSLERGKKSPTIDKLYELASVLSVHPIALLAVAHARGQSIQDAARVLRDVANACDQLALEDGRSD